MRTEPLAVDLDPGPVGRGPAAGGQPVELRAAVLVQVEAGPEDPRPARVGERSSSGDRGLEGEIVDVLVTAAKTNSLYGTLISSSAVV